ncbi:cytochrome c oxidase assembly factor-like [Andrena cerasifolii]|uniref:cytochrome c oxidase assembly factor-like n=1 Tax=Andrena cerasifolii TaxID=2819439 RepID=UPI004037810A
MSLAAKVTCGTCCAVSFSIIAYVHYKQEYDREQLHLGVIRDVERQERQRIKNLYFLEQQRELTKKLQAAQNESDELRLRGT